MKLFGEIVPGLKSDKWNISCDLRNHKAKKLLSSFPADFQNTFLKDLKGDLSANILIEGHSNKEISPSLKIEFDFIRALVLFRCM